MDLVDELDYYFIYGPEFDQIIATIRTLTEHPLCCPNGRLDISNRKNAMDLSKKSSTLSGISGARLTFRLYRTGLAVLAGKLLGAKNP